MPIVSFSNVKPVPGAAPETPTAAVVPVNPMPVDVPAEPTPQIQGDLSGARANIPFLSLGQKSSKFCDENPGLIGKWVFDKDTQVFPPQEPKAYSPELNRTLGADSLLCIFTGMRVQYEEVVEFGGGIIPTIWDTVAEAKASGMEFRERATIDLLVAFDREHDLSVDIAGLQFLPARFVARSTAFGKVAGVILRDFVPRLGKDLCSGLYELLPSKVVGKQNTYYVPVTKPAGKVTAGLRTAIKEMFGV